MHNVLKFIHAVGYDHNPFCVLFPALVLFQCVCINMPVRMSVCANIPVYEYVYVHGLYVCMCVWYVYVYMWVCSLCMCVWYACVMCLYMCVCMYGLSVCGVCLCVWCLCMYVCMCVRM